MGNDAELPKSSKTANRPAYLRRVATLVTLSLILHLAPCILMINKNVMLDLPGWIGVHPASPRIEA
jgi:hypothetical protein